MCASSSAAGDGDVRSGWRPCSGVVAFGVDVMTRGRGSSEVRGMALVVTIIAPQGEGGLFVGVAGVAERAADSAVEVSRDRGIGVRSFGNVERDDSVPGRRPRPSRHNALGVVEDIGVGSWSESFEETKSERSFVCLS